jgi:hypothetical protein
MCKMETERLAVLLTTEEKNVWMCNSV